MTAWVLGADDEPSVLATQCDDVEEAKRIAVATVRGYIGLSFCEGEEDASPEEVAAALNELEPRLEYGRIIVAQPGQDYAWWWRGRPAEGSERKRGETTAVHFRPKPYQGPVG